MSTHKNVWSCAKIQTFWENVTQFLRKMIGNNVGCDLSMCLLDDTAGGAWSKHKKQTVASNISRDDFHGGFRRLKAL